MRKYQTDGKTFQTVKKTVLNPSTEFYILKEKGKSGAKQESYIKTANQFYKIVFSYNNTSTIYL